MKGHTGTDVNASIRKTEASKSSRTRGGNQQEPLTSLREATKVSAAPGNGKGAGTFDEKGPLRMGRNPSSGMATLNVVVGSEGLTWSKHGSRRREVNQNLRAYPSGVLGNSVSMVAVLR